MAYSQNSTINQDTLVDAIYPVGSIYITLSDTDYSNFLGKTWEKITDKFLIGAGNSYAVNATGGEATHTLTESEMPKHSHSGTTSEDGDHSHKWYYTTDTFTGNVYYNNVKDTNTNKSKDTSTAGAHTHTFTTDEKGSGSAHNNMPPYLAVYMWKRTA